MRGHAARQKMAYLVGLEAPVGHPRGGSGPVDQSYIGLDEMDPAAWLSSIV